MAGPIINLRQVRIHLIFNFIPNIFHRRITYQEDGEMTSITVGCM